MAALGLFASLLLTPSATAFGPTKLSITGLEKGFLGHSAPEFRWQLRCDSCLSVRQTGYRITVHDDEDAGAAGEDVLLDTGDVSETRLRHTTASVASPHATLPLKSDRRYRWQLTVSVNVGADGAAVTGSASGYFHTALLRSADWGGAAWIGGGTSLRTDFNLASGEIVDASAYVSGAGCFELTVNGLKVAPGVFLEPSWASVPMVRMLYRAYDIKPFLQGGGANAAGLRLGMCKYGYLGGFCDGAHGATAACKAAILHISVKLADGSTHNVTSSATDGNWMATTAKNPVQYSHLFHGEIYDARLEEAGWDKPGFKGGSSWEKAVAYSGAAAQFGQLSLAQYPSVAIAESHAPVSIKPLAADTPPAGGLAGCPKGEIGAIASGGTASLQCPAGETIEEITFASFGLPHGAGRFIGGTVGSAPHTHCADPKYVTGCLFWEDLSASTKHFVTACGTPPCNVNACGKFTNVGAYAANLTDGPDFACAMMPNCAELAEGPCATKGDTVKTAVSKLCEGKPGCSIPVAAGTFGGDPCPAITAPKALAVRARCGSTKPTPTASHPWVFDFGQNMAGFATLNVSGLAPGTEITLRYGEVLNKDGSVDMAWCASPCNVGPGGGNSANQTDKFIAKGGSEPEVYTPRFTYHGYRYVQVEGLTSKPTAETLTGHFVHTNVTKDGHVEFKNESMQILNGIQKAIVYTQLSNYYHHPTDCPQREKRGWMGDSQITSAEASLNFDTTAFYTNWIQAFADTQHHGCTQKGEAGRVGMQCCESTRSSFGCSYSCPTSEDCNFTNTAGALPDVVPYHNPYGGWPGDPSWGTAGAVIPREIVVTRGETATPALYNVVRSLVDFFNSHGDAKTGGVLTFGYYGDWLDLAPHTPRPQVTGFSHLLSIHRLVEIATAAGHTADAVKYNATLQTLKAAYHKAYYDPSTKSYGASQTANLLPLFLDITTPDLVPAVAKAYVGAVSKNKYLTNSGIIGAAYMLQTLAKVGHGDIALRIALSTSEPSWGFMVTKGPGTIWCAACLCCLPACLPA